MEQSPADSGMVDFERYVAENSVALQRFAYLIAGNPEDARDAVQEALLGAYPRWSRLVGDPGPYLRRSIVNAHAARWRRHGLETPVAEVLGPGETRPSETVLDRHLVGRLARGLSYRQRVALVLRFYEDCSFAEVARVLECTEATARSVVHRALAELRSRLGGSDD
ncbi:MAG: sigma-70 family RNA polymerase sigma factor [Propionicimonas sp.]